MKCQGCGRRLYPQRCSVTNKHRHYGRGLCAPCYGVALRTDCLESYERLTVPSTQRARQWLAMKDRGWTRAEAAAHLGMTLAALEKAISRHNRAAQTPRRATARLGQ